MFAYTGGGGSSSVDLDSLSSFNSPKTSSAISSSGSNTPPLSPIMAYSQFKIVWNESMEGNTQQSDQSI